ncbi:MAG: nucleoside triphosphate pyrophosphatase [Candidatus Peribacteraceae bacterium]
MPSLRLILASASPQRKTLLRALGLDFEVVPSGIEEDDHSENDPARRAADLARLKALDISKKNRGAFVIGCDTLVVAADGTLLEKASSANEARKMLILQSGRTSLVHSALCVVNLSGGLHEGISTSKVSFKKLSEKEIDWWIDSGQWRDRSGAFQIDGRGQLMISNIEGDFTGIVGLPVFLLGQLLGKAGYPPLSAAATPGR